MASALNHRTFAPATISATRTGDRSSSSCSSLRQRWHWKLFRTICRNPLPPFVVILKAGHPPAVAPAVIAYAGPRCGDSVAPFLLEDRRRLVERHHVLVRIAPVRVSVYGRKDGNADFRGDLSHLSVRDGDRVGMEPVGDI